MATTQNKPVPARIRFALRHYFPTPEVVEIIERLMRKHTPAGLDIEDMTPRQFGQAVRGVYEHALKDASRQQKKGKK